MCGNILHRKSEYYCSKICAETYGTGTSNDKPMFLSKWKIRKRRELRDPLAKARNRIRKKTQKLLKDGKLKEKPCIVCGDRNVIAHHEDYNNPFRAIWMCEMHHKAYHNREIAIFNNRLKWNPRKLVDINVDIRYPKNKYRLINKNGE